MALLAICGAVANVWFVHLAVEALHGAHWAYRDLMHDPRAYGRIIDPETIAFLRAPYSLWFASVAFIFASIFGLLLAIHLLRSTWQIARSSDHGWQGIARYRRCKPFGIAATAISFFCFINANFNFWVTATRHVPIGSRPPVIETGILLICGLFTCWWISKPADGIGTQKRGMD